MARYEFRLRVVKESSDEYTYNHDYRQIEKTCGEWADEGFIVSSVVPMAKDVNDRMVVRLTAKRDKEEPVTYTMKFEDKDE